MELQVGVKIFLRNSERKFLILKRSPVKYPSVLDAWDIVGGRIEPGTTLLKNLERETKEEVGLSITTEPVLVAAQDILRGNGKHVVRLTYVGETQGDPVLDGEEHISYKWVTYAELLTHPDLDGYAKEILESGSINKFA